MKSIGAKGWLLFIILTIIWGSSFILMKKGMEALSASQVAAIRIFLSGIMLAPLAWLRRARITRAQIIPIAIMGLAGSGIPAFLYTEAETKISSSLAGILNSLTPIFVLLIGISFFKARYKLSNVLGILIGLAGSVALMLFESKGNLQSENTWYSLLVVLATFFYGLSNQVIMNYLKNSDPIAITSMAFVIMAPFTGAYLFSTDIVSVLKTNPQAWHSLGYTCILSIFGTSIALIIYNYLVQKTGALFASTVTYLMPVVAVMWGLLAGEALGIEHLFSMLVILAGVYLVKR